MDEFEVERVLDHRRVRCGCVWIDEYLVKWVGYGVFEATWEPCNHLANAPTALADFLATQDGLRVRTHVSQGGGVMLGFVVCLLLYAVLLLQDVFACTVRVAHVYMCGTWDRPTNKVRTVDRVRVKGLKRFKRLVK